MKVGDIFQVRDATNFMLQGKLVRITKITNDSVSYVYLNDLSHNSAQKIENFEEETFPLSELSKALL